MAMVWKSMLMVKELKVGFLCVSVLLSVELELMMIENFGGRWGSTYSDFLARVRALYCRFENGRGCLSTATSHEDNINIGLDQFSYQPHVETKQ